MLNSNTFNDTELLINTFSPADNNLVLNAFIDTTSPSQSTYL